MRRVYLQLWLAVVAIVVTALAVYEVMLWNESYSTEESAYYEQYATAGVRATAESALTGPELEAQLVGWWSAPITLLDTAPAMPDHAYPMTGIPDAWWAASDDGGDLLVVRTRGGTWVRVGPMLPYPSPDLWNRALIVLGVMFAVALATLLLLRPLDRAQRAIVRTARAIGEGDLGARVEESDFSAAPGMGEALNDMADRVEALLSSRQSLLRTASHELRTPIARLRIGVHLLSTAEADRGEREAALDADLEELDALVDELLTHARLQDGRRVADGEWVPIEPVVDEVIEQLSIREGVDVEVDVGEHGVMADRVLFRRVVRNLLSNAVRYAEARVRVRCEPRDGAMAVIVEDDGPGIPEADRAVALAPFGMLDDRSEHGLGLAIVHEVLARHGGDVALGASNLGGLQVTTRWHRAEEGR